MQRGQQIHLQICSTPMARADRLKDIWAEKARIGKCGQDNRKRRPLRCLLLVELHKQKIDRDGGRAGDVVEREVLRQVQTGHRCGLSVLSVVTG